MISAFLVALYSALGTPLLAAMTIYTFTKNREKLASAIATVASSALVIETLICLVCWGRGGFIAKETVAFNLYVSEDYRFPFVLFFDTKAAVFLAMTSFLGALTVKYSRYYLHRERGYARFFATIFIFLFGMSFLALAGTLDLLFASWEIVGISSFLLIGFYRERLSPVRNALRAYYIYRLCDAGILLSAWLGHILWHASVRFSGLEGGGLIPETPSLPLMAMSFLLVLAASGKSAQFPFSFWLPRAMEGPTPSSAIFYGGLSIHAGVFLLLRTEAIWLEVSTVRIVMAVIGALSALLATMSGRIQANIKGQIAYASIAQVGLMLIELALGFSSLALFHFVANACLRSYQLLVSPSVVAHLMRVQGAADSKFRLSDWSFERRLPPRVRSTFYVLALNEGYLEAFLHRALWVPLIWLGNTVRRCDSLGTRYAVGFAAGAMSTSLVLGYTTSDVIVAALTVLALVLSLFALAERGTPKDVWNSVGFSSLLFGVALCARRHASRDLWVYLSGIMPAWILGRVTLQRLLPEGSGVYLKRFHGLGHGKSGVALILFLSFIGLVGFPITPAFVGEDLLLHHASEGHRWIAVIVAGSFVLNGLTLVRLFAHLCLGPPPKGGPMPPSWRLENENT